MSFTPAVTKLRRTAKACAAGELSRHEYRLARRRVIEEFEGCGASWSDATLPRFSMDVTQKREPVTASVEAPPASKGWLWWILFVFAALSALALPNIVGAQEIPAVAERDPNPLTAQRLNVEAVSWDAPEFFAAVSQAEIDAFLAQALLEIKESDRAGSHGFSAGELEEVGRFLNAIGVHDDQTQVTNADLQDLKALVANQKARRGVSVVQLEKLAAQLQEWIRSYGYPIAMAYIPSQDVTQGVVKIDVQFGELASVVVQGSSQSPAGLRSLLGQPVRRAQIETQLNMLNRLAGIQTVASFAPGAAIGESELRLEVQQNQDFVGQVQLDNYGAAALGEERLSVQGVFNGISGLGDQLFGRVTTSVDPADHQFYSVGYRSAVFGGRFDLSGRVAYGDIDLTDAGAGSSDGLLFDLTLTDTQLLTREHRREFSYGIGVHDFSTETGLDQQARFLHASTVGHRLWDAQQTALHGSISVHLGQFDDTFPGQDQTWWRVRSQVKAWRALSGLGEWLRGMKAVIALNGQWASDGLPPTMQLSATGMHANRGFEHGGIQYDQGATLSGELRWDAPLGQVWAYLDAGYGERDLGQSIWSQLTSVGLGWEASFEQGSFRGLHTKLTLGYPVSHKGPGGNYDEGTQLYWSLRYSR